MSVARLAALGLLGLAIGCQQQSTPPTTASKAAKSSKVSSQAPLPELALSPPSEASTAPVATIQRAVDADRPAGQQRQAVGTVIDESETENALAGAAVEKVRTALFRLPPVDVSADHSAEATPAARPATDGAAESAEVVETGTGRDALRLQRLPAIVDDASPGDVVTRVAAATDAQKPPADKIPAQWPQRADAVRPTTEASLAPGEPAAEVARNPLDLLRAIGNARAKTEDAHNPNFSTQPVQLPSSRRTQQFVAQPTSPPPVVVEGLAPGSPVDAATPVTLHLDNADIRQALEMLSRQAGLNILVSPRVAGKVTANLQNLSIDEALGALLRLSNLVAHRENNLIYVYTPGEFTGLHDRDHVLVTRIYHLNYVRAADVQQIITPFLSTGVGKISTTPTSDVGIGTDENNVGGDAMAGGEILIVQDHESVIRTLDAIVQQLDAQPLQVVIEAVIMEVVLDDTTQLGVNFAVLDGAGKALAVFGNGAAINAAAGFDPASVLTAGGKLAEGFTAPNNGLKFGFVDDDVTGFIDALETTFDTNILAAPRVVVLNKQRAELIIGERIGYTTLTLTETASVQDVKFLDVGTQLRLRPFVASNGMIRMEIHPERSTGDIVDGLPRERTNELTTNIIVRDGSTIVLGGLIEDEETLDETGIPVLNRIPWVGALFRDRLTTTKKKELIVLLTPRIWNPGEAGLPAEGTVIEQVSGPGSGAPPQVLPAPSLPVVPGPVTVPMAPAPPVQQQLPVYQPSVPQPPVQQPSAPFVPSIGPQSSRPVQPPLGRIEAAPSQPPARTRLERYVP